jgi:hypothetical protein
VNIRHHFPLLLGSLLLSAALGFAAWRQSNPPWKIYQPDGQVRTLIPTISNKPELCLTCHNGLEEISGSHPVDVFGCVSCHGGDPLSLDQSLAHRDLLGPGGNPADFTVADQSCGTAQCHGGDLDSNRNHLARAKLSLHATYAGAITAALQSQNISGQYGIDEIHASEYGPVGTIDSLLALDPSTFDQPAVTTFAQNCLTCHLGAQPVDAPGFYRGSGCAACHTPYSAEGRYSGGDPTISKDEPGHPARHALTVIMPYTQCAACHSRGTYSIQSLTFTPRNAATLDAGRKADYQPHSDPTAVKCERELDCIDCHNASEVMGDSYLYPDLAASPTVECRTCHGTLTEPPPLITLTDPNHPAFRRDLLNDNYTLREGDAVVQSPNGDVLGAARWQENRLVLTSRITGQTFFVPPVQGSACQQKPEQQEARYCRECHTLNP